MSCPKRKIEGHIQADCNTFFSTPPKKQKMDNNPTIAYCKKSNLPFFIYGLEHARGTLRDAARKQITIKDYRYNFLTVDNFNNPALSAINSGCQKEIDSYLSKIENQTLKTFAQAHLEKIKKQFSQLEQEDNNESKKISFACNSAITTAGEHGFKLFFVLDDIDFNELNGKYKHNFTTAELRTIHNEMSKRTNLSHIQFIEKNQLIAHDVVQEKLAAAFSPKLQSSPSTKKVSSSSSSSPLFNSPAKNEPLGSATSSVRFSARLNFADNNSSGDDEANRNDGLLSFPKLTP